MANHHVEGDDQVALCETASQLFGGHENAWKELGISRASWFRYRALTRAMPRYIVASIRAHSKLDWHKRRLAAAQERIGA